jgi:hypothetical protein
MRPLTRRYSDEISLPGKRHAKGRGVSQSRIYMSRNRNVGADDARNVARAVASILGPCERVRLLLAQ